MELVFLCGRHCHRPPGPPAEFAGHLLTSEACGQEAGKSREPLRGMALFQEVPTVCGDTSCQGAPAFPGALSSADGFLKL